MIHARRETEDYEFLARNIGIHLEKIKITTCGSDGEKAIMAGFRRVSNFQESKWLICMLHAKDNCLTKMVALGIGEGTRSTIVRDIYGSEVGQEQERRRFKGIIDAESAMDFDDSLDACSKRWDILEEEETNKPPRFSTNHPGLVPGLNDIKLRSAKRACSLVSGDRQAWAQFQPSLPLTMWKTTIV